MLEKLKFHGINGSALNWFASYLSERLQYVVFNSSPSSVAPVDFGVPQGGGISPILFILFINDIVKCSPNAGCVLYADDTSLYVYSLELYDVFYEARTILMDYFRRID